MPTEAALARYLALPESRSAWEAVCTLRDGVLNESESRPVPLYLHGPAGTGKTRLAQDFTADLERAGCTVRRWAANDFAEGQDVEDNLDADLLIVEDLQHLPPYATPILIRLLDDRQRDGSAMLVTANVGPGRLQLRGSAIPARLRSRLAAGLVLELAPWQAPSRRKLLQESAGQHGLNVAPDILDWLAKHLIGGGRQLDGAIRQLKALQGAQRLPLRLSDVRAHLHAQVQANAPSVERITAQVGNYFQVPPKRLASARRSQDVLIPRQISMYLARQLTNLSLQEIGAHFGGRDHKTVQHACRKVEQTLKADIQWSGVVRQLHAQLS